MAEDIPQKARVPAETAALRILQAQTGTANFAQRSLRQIMLGILRVLAWAEGRAASVNPPTPVADLSTQVGIAAIFLVADCSVLARVLWRQSCWCSAGRVAALVIPRGKPLRADKLQCCACHGWRTLCARPTPAQTTQARKAGQTSRPDPHA